MTVTYEQARLDLLMLAGERADAGKAQSKASNSEWLDQEAKKAREEAERKKAAGETRKPIMKQPIDPEFQKALDACGDGNTSREAAMKRLALLMNPPVRSDQSFALGPTKPPPDAVMTPYNPLIEDD